MHTWSRGQLYESLIHLLDLVVAAYGGAVTVTAAHGVGESRPEQIAVAGAAARGRFSIVYEPYGGDDVLEIEIEAGARKARWTRRGELEELTTIDAQGARSRSPARGSDLARLLAAWARAVRGGATPIAAEDGVVAMRLASEVLKRLEAASVPFDRAGAPRHASSRELRERYD
jgi:hypothetical protein